jgi:hypothetical protein
MTYRFDSSAVMKQYAPEWGRAFDGAFSREP